MVGDNIMAFSILSKIRSPLTFSRENAILRHSLSNGVYSGLQVYPDASTVDYQISIFGGYAAVAGVLIYDDEDRTEVLDLGSPVDATGDHHLIWLDISSGSAEYSVKTGTFAAPATLSPSEQESGVILADVYIPNGATSINDSSVTISNRPHVRSNEELTHLAGRHLDFTCQKAKVTNSTTVYTLHLLGAKMIALNPFRGASGTLDRAPLIVHTIISNDSSADYVGGYEVEVDVAGSSDDDYILFYTREPEDWVNNSLPVRVYGLSFSSASGNFSEADLQQLIGNSGDPVSEIFPHRSDLANISVIAIVDVDNSAVIMPKWTMEVGTEYENGSLNTYTQSLSSTAYGTGPVTPGGAGDIDLDDIISNASKLSAATLDTAYDGFGAAAAQGSGYQINVDRQPITASSLNNDDTEGGRDKFRSTFRVRINEDGFDDAEYEETAFEALYLTESFNGPSERRVVSTIEPANINGKLVLLSSDTWSLDGGGRVVPTTLGTLSINDFYSEYGFYFWEEMANDLLISFSGTGEACDDKLYRLKWDGSASNFYIEDTDASPGTTALSADFPTLPTSLTSTIWESIVSIAPARTRLNNVEIRGTLRGPASQELVLDEDTMIKSSYELADFISRSRDGDTAIAGRLDSRCSVSTLVGTNARPIISTDGVYVYQLQRTIAGSPVSVSLYSCKDGTFVKTIASSANSSDVAEGLCCAWEGAYLWIAFDDVVELWNVDTEALIRTYSIGFHVNDIKAASGCVFIAHDYDAGNLASVSIYKHTSVSADGQYRPTASGDAQKIDVHGDAMIVYYDGGSKNGVAIADIRSLASISTIELRDYATDPSFIEDPLAVSIHDNYVSVFGSALVDGSDVFYVESYTLGNLSDPISVHYAPVNDVSGNTINSSTVFMFADRDLNWIVYRESGTSPVSIVYAIDWRTGGIVCRQEYNIAATNKTFQGATFDFRNVYISDVHASNMDLLKVTMGKPPLRYTRKSFLTGPYYKIAGVES